MKLNSKEQVRENNNNFKFTDLLSTTGLSASNIKFMRMPMIEFGNDFNC